MCCKLGSQKILVFRKNPAKFSKHEPFGLSSSSGHETGKPSVYMSLKNLILGKPLASDEDQKEMLSVFTGVPVLGLW